MNIPILYENKDLLVINKPANISVHSAGKNIKEKTITDWFTKNYPKSNNVGEPFWVNRKGGEKEEILRSGIVHRLDKDTTGALILAKNQKAFLFIKNQFIKHQVEKVYRAFVYGNVKDPKASLLTKKRGVINAPIGRSPNNIRMWTAGRGARSHTRDAITEYIVLDRTKDNQFSYLELYPKTGRTHQIRVHLRYINHPIVSDSLYAGKKLGALGFERLALHAYSITFKLPNSQKQTVIASYPKDFKEAIKKYIK